MMKILLAIVLLGYMIFGAATEEEQAKKPRREYTLTTTADGVIVKDTAIVQAIYIDSNQNSIVK